MIAQTNAERAVAAYNAMQQHFFVQDGTSLYRLTCPWSGGNTYSYVWEFSRALVGTLALAGVDPNYAAAVQNRFAALERYWDAHVPAFASYTLSEGGGDTYYDDNAWIALAFIQRYRMGLTNSLDRPKQLFTFGRSGWDTKASQPCPGGIFWVKQGSGYGLTNHDRGTGATMGNAELGYHLHLLTGSANYDADASNMADWVNAYADSSGNGSGLYWNVVRDDGSIDTNLWSYNQGVALGTNVLRYQLTANSSYVAQAVAIATKSLAGYGNFQGQPPSFNVMLFQNLLMLYPYASSSLQGSILQTMQAYADWAWNTRSARDPKTNLFYFDDAGKPVGGSGQEAQLRDQGAMTQLYALLAWRSSDYGKLT